MPLTELVPQEITNPFCPTEPLMPAMKDIPEEFKHSYPVTTWNKLFNDWFFFGVNNLVLVPKPGIVYYKALRHIRIVMAGFDSAHEHKEAACAYLFSLWFESATWSRNSEDLKA